MEALSRTPDWRVEETPGARDFRRLPNPVGAEALFEHVRRLERPAGLHHSLSVTGGEPLLQHRFLAALLPEAYQRLDKAELLARSCCVVGVAGASFSVRRGEVF